MDTTISENLRQAIININVTGQRASVIAGDLNSIVKGVQAGKGTAGKLLTDTMFAHRLNQTMINIQSISDSISIIASNFKAISEKINNGNGTVGSLLNDTTLTNNLNQSLLNLKYGTNGFNENMEALKVSWPFKKYFKNQKKAKLKK